jgi:hypothetical protein
VPKPHFSRGGSGGPRPGDENRGTDGSVHTAQWRQRLDRESCARLGQRRQSPVFLEDSRYLFDEFTALMKEFRGA